MTLSDFWSLIHQLESAGQDVDLLKVAVNTAELNGLKTVDEALARLNAGCLAFSRDHEGAELFTSPAGQTLRIVALNAVSQGGQPEPRENGNGRELSAKQARNREKWRHNVEYGKQGRIIK